MLEHAGGVAAYSGVMMVAVDKNQVERLSQGSQVEGGGVAVQVRDVGQRLRKKAVQGNVFLRQTQSPHFISRKVEGVHGSGYGGYVGGTLAAPGADFEVAAAGVPAGQAAQQG